MLDLSEEKDKDNIETCVKYFTRMAKINMWLEMEIGITGGEEDGVDNTGVRPEELYTKPEQVCSRRLDLNMDFVTVKLTISGVRRVQGLERH